MKYLIGVDIGTTHTKAVVITTTGEVLMEEKASYATRQSSPGYQEQDPDDILKAALLVLQAVIAGLDDSSKISDICFSAAMHSVMAIDAQGNGLTPLFTWADTRSNEYALQLRHTEAGREIYLKTGTPVHPMSPLCKIAWIRDKMPGIFARTHKFISGKEYVFYKLFGKYIIDYSVASATGLFDIGEMQWNHKAMAFAGISETYLSTPVPPGHFETGLKDHYRLRLSLRHDARFMVGSSDGGLAILGSGAVLPGEAALTIGTSGAVRTLTPQPLTDQKGRLFTYLFTDNLYICGGAINNGGIVLKWFAENVLDKTFSSDDAFTWFIKTAFLSPIGSRGLVFLPYIFGERAPVWDAGATGTFSGISNMHRKEDFMRAILEGISFSLYQVTRAIEDTGSPIHTIYASGGFISSNGWLQMIADILDKKIVVSHAADASALGAAFLGLYSSGVIQHLAEVKEMVVNSAVFVPDAGAHQAYIRNFEIFETLYPHSKT